MDRIVAEISVTVEVEVGGTFCPNSVASNCSPVGVEGGVGAAIVRVVEGVGRVGLAGISLAEVEFCGDSSVNTVALGYKKN